MRKIYLAFLTLCSAGLATAQVTVPADLTNADGFIYTDISEYVTADTTATGEQNNVVYLLEAGGVYAFTREVTWDFDVVLRATGDIEADGRPIILRVNLTGASDFDPMYRGFGSFTWDGLYIIMGEEGPEAAAYETASFRPQGDDKRFVFNNCIIEKSRQGTMRIEGANSVAILTNNYIRNFGDYEQLQGNGRLVDPRDNFIDSVIIRNNYVHNILDRLYIGLRNPGGNYLDLSGNTVFNHVGRHGFVQLGSMRETHINNNLFLNTQIMGTHPSYANEQIMYKGEVIYQFSIDSLPVGATAEMRNNAIYWQPQVEELWATFDSIEQAPLLSPELATLIGDTTESFIYGEFSLGNVPSVDPLVQYTREAVTYPDSTGITDIIVEDTRFIAANPAYDNGNNFNFAEFDPCLAEGSPYLNASTNGGPLGATWMCDYGPVGVKDVNYNRELALEVMPNPAASSANFSFMMLSTGQAELNVYDARGSLVKSIHDGTLAAGQHSMDMSGLNALSNGMYFVNLRTPEGRMFKRLVVQH